MSFGFKIGERTLADFGQVVASRSIGAPSKKLVTKTVPHMSGFYDFSKLYGVIPYESREVQYVIDLIGDRDEVQQQRSDLMTWLSTVHDANIFDEDLDGWHFRGSFSSFDWSEGESGESGSLTVTFICQPFMIADEETTQTLAVSETTITNEGQATYVTAVSEAQAQVTLGGITQSVGTTPVRLSSMLLEGDNPIKIENSPVTLKWSLQRL